MLDMDRRTFLGTMAAAVLASRGGAAASIQNIGMQLYTVRTDLEKDFAGTLAKVAAIGYKEVEFAGYFNHTPKQVKETLTANGLTSPSAHIDYATLGPDKLPAALDAAHTIGHTFLVNPVDRRIDPSRSRAAGSGLRRPTTVPARRAKKAGIQFAYHNHNFEFAPVDGKLPYDVLLESCDPALVKMELDLCWISAAGKDPRRLLQTLPGPFSARAREGAVEGDARAVRRRRSTSCCRRSPMSAPAM